jgi:ribonuclease E
VTEAVDGEPSETPAAAAAAESSSAGQNGMRKRRRRGKRGGRRRRHGETTQSDTAGTLTADGETGTPVEETHQEADGQPFAVTDSENGRSEETDIGSDAMAQPWQEPSAPAFAEHEAALRPEQVLPVESHPEPIGAERRSPEPLRQAPETPALERQPESSAQSEEPAQDKPRRRGWWQRVLE